MHPVKLSSLFLVAAMVPVCTQAPEKKPAAAKPPAEAIVGVWHGKGAAGDEYVTFTAGGRAIMQRGPEMMSMNYKLNVSAAPWRLDMSGKLRDIPVTIYTVFDFPAPDQFRMAPPSPDESKRPDAKTLAQTKLVLQRLTIGAHTGIFQVVDATLKKLAGTWEGKDGSETVTLTFSADGSYTMKVADFSDKGRFRIDVSKVPLGIDLLSSEGAGAKYSIFDFKDGSLLVGKAGTNPDERPVAFEEVSTRTYKHREKSSPAK